MFEFFAALFGGAYYAGKYANERIKDKEYEAQQLTKQAFIEKIHASPEMEWEAEKLLTDTSRVAEIFRVLREDLIEIFGKEEYRIRLNISPYIRSFRGTSNHSYWCKLLLLSKKGKLPINECLEIPIGVDNRDFCIAAAKRIEKNMRAFYPEIRLVENPNKQHFLVFQQTLPVSVVGRRPW